MRNYIQEAADLGCGMWEKTLNVSNSMGIAGLFVDAKHQQAKTYYHQFGFIGMPEQLDNMFMLISTIAKSFAVL